MHNPMFITPDLSIQLHNILALSRSGSSLNVHLHNGGKIPFLPTGEWNLEEYTDQWKSLIAEDQEYHDAQQARMEARYPAPGALQAMNVASCPGEAAVPEPVTAKTVDKKTSAKPKPKTNNKD